MTSRPRDCSSGTLAPALLLLAVAVVCAAQLWNVVPIAGAIAIAGWGTALVTPRRPWILIAAAVYVPLVLLAVASQLDAASTGSLLRRFMTAVDSGAAGALMVLLVRRA